MEFSFTHELIHRLKVFQAMTPQMVTVEPTVSMRRAQHLMRESRVSGMPVVGHSELVGIVTVEDIIQALDHGHIEEPVGRWMTRDVVCVEKRWPVNRAMSILDRTGFGQLPVLDESCQLIGVITAESIMRAMLFELNRLLGLDETREAAAVHAADEALRMEFNIAPQDYDSAGLASVRLKRELAARGIDPGLQRRVAIATHEAETNLILHSNEGGQIFADVGPEAIRLTVTDTGPGIEDIEQALMPGYSTASDWVRDLGFGAGMGLPNIRKCADHFEIRSKPGYGTRLNLRFDYPPRPHESSEEAA